MLPITREESKITQSMLCLLLSILNNGEGGYEIGEVGGGGGGGQLTFYCFKKGGSFEVLAILMGGGGVRKKVPTFIR